MSDDNDIIDVEAVEFEDSDNLPAVIEKPWNAESLEADSVTRSNGVTYGAKAGRSADGVSLNPETVARHDAALRANPERRCVATTSKGQCRKFAILGSTVCKTHGGATKQVVNKARVRVQNASNRLMGKLIEFAFDDTKPPDTQLRAIRDSLDRAGLRPPAEVVLSQGETKPYEELFEGISTMSREESRRARGLPDAEDSLAGFAPGAEGNACLPRTHSDPDVPNRPPNQQARRESWDPTTDQREPDHQGHSAGKPSGMQAGEERAATADLRPHPVRRAPVRHITGDDAIAAANAANRAIGALPEPKALTSAHKRYRRP